MSRLDVAALPDASQTLYSNPVLPAIAWPTSRHLRTNCGA